MTPPQNQYRVDEVIVEEPEEDGSKPNSSMIEDTEEEGEIPGEEEKYE